MEIPEPLVLYDGRCGFCDRVVRFLCRRDRDGRLRFAPLQGRTAERLRAAGLPVPEDLSSVVLVEGDRVHLRSRAVLGALAHLPPPWCWLRHLRVVPAPLADVVYLLVARLRRRLAGAPACPLPPDLGERFLP